MFTPTSHGFYEQRNPFRSLRFFAARPDIDDRDARLTVLTTYLSMDGDYVTIWHGLFDPGISQSVLGDLHPLPDGLDFGEQYYQPLFDGYIKDDETGRVVLEALRLGRFVDQRLAVVGDTLQCDTFRFPTG